MERITLQQVARRAGVSTATASHALKGSGRVSALTREKVRTAAEALGYRPDPMLSALVTYRQRQRSPAQTSANLAFLLHPRNEGEWSPSAVSWRHWEAAREAAEELGYALETFDLNAHERLGSAARILRERGVRGVILPSHRNRQDLADFPLEHFAAVELGYTNAAHKELDRVTMNDFLAMRQTWAQLLARGYRRIGLVLNPSTDLNSGGAWSAAYYMEQQRAAEELGISPIPLLPLSEHPPDYVQTFERWFRQHRPDALISRRSLRKILDALGLRAPRDLGYTNLGVPESGSSTAGTIFNTREIGRTAVHMLDHSLRHGRLGLPEYPRTVLISPRWNEGESLRAMGDPVGAASPWS